MSFNVRADYPGYAPWSRRQEMVLSRKYASDHLPVGADLELLAETED